MNREERVAWINLLKAISSHKDIRSLFVEDIEEKILEKILESLIKERKIDFTDSNLNSYEVTSVQVDIQGRFTFKGFEQ